MRSDIRAQEPYRDIPTPERYDVSRQTRYADEPFWGLLVTGLAIVGVGILAWDYFGAT